MLTAMETGTAGVGLKLTNQNAEPSQIGSSAATQTTDEDHSSSVVPPAGETMFEQTGTTQVSAVYSDVSYTYRIKEHFFNWYLYQMM